MDTLSPFTTGYVEASFMKAGNTRLRFKPAKIIHLSVFFFAGFNSNIIIIIRLTETEEASILIFG